MGCRPLLIDSRRQLLLTVAHRRSPSLSVAHRRPRRAPSRPSMPPSATYLCRPDDDVRQLHVFHAKSPGRSYRQSYSYSYSHSSNSKPTGGDQT